MKKFLPLFLVLLAILVTGCRQRPTPNINIEQAEHTVASKILSPGMGTIGLIEEGKVSIYYMDEDRRWLPDTLSQFNIPENNEGLLTLGSGTIGVIMNSQIHLYRLDNYDQWVTDPSYNFSIPKRYDRILTANMPWELGMLLLAKDSNIDFYYFNEETGWVIDETATFKIPPGIKHYFSLGDMTIGVADDKKLGVYYLHPEGEWQFVEDMVLQLPEDYDAIIPWDTGFIAILKGDVLEFYMLDLEEGIWLHIEDMAFTIQL